MKWKYYRKKIIETDGRDERGTENIRVGEEKFARALKLPQNVEQ